MSGANLLLGPILFQDFEIPRQINFGGAQQLTVHRLPGGGRVIDAMGRDDADITWSGTLSGNDAVARARDLDLLRVAGLPLPLAWDSFFYSVLIARFDANYQAPFWIPYRIRCTVLRDESSALLTQALSLAAAGAQDLATAASYGPDLSDAQAALGASNATTLGTAAYGTTVRALTAASGSISGALASAEANFAMPATADGFAATVSAAGQMAQLTTARGYVARTATNLANASS